MKPGVSKSGSPAPKPTTSTPAFLRALALALTLRVIDSEIRYIRSASEIIVRLLRWIRRIARYTGPEEGSNSGGSLSYFPQHFLYFLPLPQGQGSFRPTLG